MNITIMQQESVGKRRKPLKRVGVIGGNWLFTKVTTGHYQDRRELVRSPEQDLFDSEVNDGAVYTAASRQYYPDWEQPIQKHDRLASHFVSFL